MRFNIENLFEKYQYDETQKSYFSGFNIVDVAYRKIKELVILKIENDTLLPFDEYCDLIKYLDSLGIHNVKLLFKLKNNSLNKFYIVEKYFELKAIHNI